MPGVDEDGFAIFRDVFDVAEFTAVLTGLGEVQRSRAGARHAFSLPPVRELARDKRLMQIARASLGGSAFPFRATLFDKSPRANWLVVWHQDTALPLCERREVEGWGPWSTKEGVLHAHSPARALEQVLAIRVHLDDSHEENGPLRVLRATHRRGVLTDDVIHDLAVQMAAFTCCVNAGGVVAMKPLLVHASSKARGHAGSRRVLHIEYAATMDFKDGIRLRVC